MRVIIAHKGGYTEELEMLRASVMGELTAARVDAEVHLGSEDYERRFAACGSDWDRWARQVGGGTETDGRPTYDLLVFPDRQIGRATTTMVQAALAAGRSVVYREAGVAYHEVTGTRVVSGSWKDGTLLVLGRRLTT